MTLDWTEHELRQRIFAREIHAKLAKALNAKAFTTHISRALRREQYQSTHVQGGTIMGDSPESGVVNRWLQHWRMPNLWVIGGSTFPQNSSGNPILTALAIGYRTADAFLSRYFKRPGPLA